MLLCVEERVIILLIKYRTVGWGEATNPNNGCLQIKLINVQNVGVPCRHPNLPGYQYFGVKSNYKAIEAAYEYTEKAWRYWLSRRSHKGKVLFETLQETFPLPKPGIVHNI